MIARVLAVGGTDPLSGAGIIADAIAILECGAHPLTVASATVDQDSRGVRGFAPSPEPWFSRALEAALRDGRPDAIKVGMIGDAAHADALASAILDHTPAATPIVLDPVLSGGVGGGAAALGRAASYAPLLELTATRPVVLTPNADEIGALLEEATPTTVDQLQRLAVALAERTGAAVVAKGGHVEPAGTDVTVFGGVTRVLAPVRGPSEDIHGTGCRLASAIATALARGAGFDEAVASARGYMALSFAERVARVGAGRPQFVAAAALLRAAIPSVTEPVPRPLTVPEEKSE